MLTVAGHTAAAGSVDAIGLAVTTVVAVGLGAAVTSRPLRFSRLLVVLLAGQGLLHLLLTVSSSHAHGSPAAGPSGITMAGGHVLAAAIAAKLVTHADDLITRWTGLLGARLGWRRPALAIPESGPADLIPAFTPGASRPDALVHDVSRRGPPAARALVHA